MEAITEMFKELKKTLSKGSHNSISTSVKTWA